jgi:hypothetical protein
LATPFALGLDPDAFRQLSFTVAERHVELGEEADDFDPW